MQIVYKYETIMSSHLPFEAMIEKYRSVHEPKHHWELKKKFMMKHRDSFEPMELVGLAQTFGNIEFLGCTYPPDTMKQVRLLSNIHQPSINDVIHLVRLQSYPGE